MRLFVAVWPPEEVGALLAALPRDRPGLRWTRPEQWHVTLRFLGDVDSAEPVRAALGDVRSPPCQAAFGRVVRLGSAVGLSVVGLDELAAAVLAATASCVPPEPRPFRGHLTLARSRRPGAPRCPELAVTASWPVDRFALVESHLGRPVTYEDIAVYPLG